jgi:hypothetical protein
MYERILDINSHQELSDLKNKKTIPFAIFFDIPFVSTSMYNDIIYKELLALEIELPGISRFEYYILSIEDIESYSYVKKHITLHELCREVKENKATSFESEVFKICQKHKIKWDEHKSFLDKKFDKYFTDDLNLSQVIL